MSDYMERSITPEFARNFAKCKWIKTDAYLPRASNGKESEDVIGVYSDTKGQHIITAYFDWKSEKWRAKTLTPPFEYNILYWMPFPKTPKDGGEIYL